MPTCRDRDHKTCVPVRYAGHYRTAGRPFLACLLLVSTLILASPTLRAQNGPDSDSSLLVPTDDLRSVHLYRLSAHGWIGFERGMLATRIILYDSLFSEVRQSLWGGFVPIDFTLHFDPERRDSVGLLLGITRNRVTLYELDFAGLRLVPLWEGSDLREPAGMITVDRTGLLLYGDGVVALLDSSMTIRARIDTEILAPPTLLGSDSIFLLHRDIGGVHAMWTGAGSLDRGDEITLGGNRSRLVVSSVDRTAEARKYVIAMRESGTIVTIDPAVRSIERFPLPPIFPDFLTLAPIGSPPHSDEIPVGISVDYPGPRIYSTDHPDGHRLHYPLLDPPVGIISSDAYHLLYTHDSIVLYDADFEYRNTQGWPGGSDIRVVGLPDRPGVFLVTGRSGTSLLSLQREGIDIVQRYGPIAGLFIAILLGLVTIILVIERYRRMRAIFRALVTGSSAAGVMIFSRRGRLVRANRQALEMLGLAESTPLGRHILTYFRTLELRDVRGDVRRLITTGLPVDRQITVEHGNRSRTLRVLVRRMIGRYGSNRGILLALEDLTENVERDRLLNWASVAHHIAHEMKTPLGTIRTSADMLRGELLSHGSGDVPLSMLGRIIRQGARLREIVEDLLTVARSDSLVFNQVDLVLLLRAIADDMREYTPPTCAIRVDSSLESCTVQADADQLAVALRNLLDNARQAIGSRENGLIECSLEVEDEGVRISVKDNGIGMTEETRRRLFQPFYSEKEGGSGIGTTILKRVVEGHGGWIEVQSEPGRGSQFDLLLPLRRQG